MALLEDPRNCHFDPRELLCQSANGQDCLTAPQIEALRKIYEGRKTPHTGVPIFPGYPPGTESVTGGWNTCQFRRRRKARQFRPPLAIPFTGRWCLKKPVWEFKT